MKVQAYGEPELKVGDYVTFKRQTGNRFGAEGSDVVCLVISIEDTQHLIDVANGRRWSSSTALTGTIRKIIANLTEYDKDWYIIKDCVHIEI